MWADNRKLHIIHKKTHQEEYPVAYKIMLDAGHGGNRTRRSDRAYGTNIPAYLSSDGYKKGSKSK